MQTAVDHSGNDENEGYSATLVILLGKERIAEVLDQVEGENLYGYYPPKQEDVEAFAAPMAIIVQSATRSGNPQARAIADQYIAEANDVETYGGYATHSFEPPESRRRLGLLLTAGTGDAEWEGLEPGGTVLVPTESFPITEGGLPRLARGAPVPRALLA